jgi:hypothetical protein
VQGLQGEIKAVGLAAQAIFISSAYLFSLGQLEVILIESVAQFFLQLSTITDGLFRLNLSKVI